MKFFKKKILTINSPDETCTSHRISEIQSIAKVKIEDKFGIRLYFKNNNDSQFTCESLKERNETFVKICKTLEQN